MLIVLSVLAVVKFGPTAAVILDSINFMVIAENRE